MSLQLGETFSGCKIERPVQRVPRTEHPLLFKHNELPKIFLPKANNRIHYSPLYLFSRMTEVLLQSYDSYQLVKVMESRKVTFDTVD